MADAMDDVVENTQRSVCASSEDRVVEEQLQDEGGCSIAKPPGDMPTDIRKRPNATSAVEVPSPMCISPVASSIHYC